MTTFSEKVSTKLKNNLPTYTGVGRAMSCSVGTVPRSSSLTNVLDNPDMLEKKMMTHSIPARTSLLTDSLPRENKMTERAVTTNMNSALSA